MHIDSYLQQLVALPTVLQARLSPDQRWIAFMWYRVHENVDIFLVPSDGSTPPIALNHTPEYTWLVNWTPDSHAILLAEDHDGDERLQLFRIDLGIDDQGRPNPQPMQPITEESPPYFLRGGALAPDGQSLYYGANYDFSADQPIEATWIYRHNLPSGQRIPIARPNRPAYTTPELNQAGTHLIYARKDRQPSGRQFYLVDVQGSEDREILNFGDQVKVFARWFPDSEHILILVETIDPSMDNEYIKLGVYHWPTGQQRWLIDMPQRSIENAWVSPDGSILVDEIIEAAHKATYLLPPDSGSWLSSEPIREIGFPTVKGNLIPIGRSVDGGWVALHYASTSPPDLVRLTNKPGEEEARPVSLTGVWDYTDLAPERLVQAEAFHWKSDDDLVIQGWLYRANPNPNRAVIYIHGGPSSHSEDKLNPQIQYLVAYGYNVLDVNYRGSTGFGLKFRELIKEDGWGGREQADIVNGAQALIQAGLAAPGKVGITGTSYGGYSSWHLITHYSPEIIGASAPICGMTDLVIDYQTTRPDLRPLSEEMMGGNPTEAPKRYYERSPINFVENIRGKLLIVQGAMDPNVTPENVRLVTERLDQYQIPYELLVFEDEGHGIKKPPNQIELYRRLATFFDTAFI